MATGPSGVAALETQKPSFVRSDILQADDSFDEGNRPIEDVLISGNVVTDLAVHDLYLNDNAIDTCVLISQYNATPQNVVVKGNVFAQRTATAGRNWSDLKLRGIDGENRQWRLDPGNVLMFADDVLVGEASSAPARWCASRRRTVLTASSSTSTTLRLQPMWEGTQSWAVAARLDRVSGRRAGAGHRRRPARLSADPARRLGRHRRRARRHNDETPILAGRRVDLDRNGGAELTLSGTGDQTTWGGFVDIPDALRQSIGVQLVRQQWQRRDLGDDHLDRGGREERRSDQRRPPAAVVGAAVGEAGGKRNGAAQLQPTGHRRHRLRGGAAAGRSVRHQRLARRQTPCGRVRKVAAITVFPPHPRRHLVMLRVRSRMGPTLMAGFFYPS